MGIYFCFAHARHAQQHIKHQYITHHILLQHLHHLVSESRELGLDGYSLYHGVFNNLDNAREFEMGELMHGRRVQLKDSGVVANRVLESILLAELIKLFNPSIVVRCIETDKLVDEELSIVGNDELIGWDVELMMGDSTSVMEDVGEEVFYPVL
jgi:hypothetical protein